MLLNSKLRKADGFHGFPVIGDIVGGPPQVSTRLRTPIPHIAPSVFAKAKHDRTSSLRQCHAHLLVGSLQVSLGRLIDAPCSTPGVLEIVIAPIGEGLRIFLFMTHAAGIAAADIGPGRSVNSDLQALSVYVIGKSLHVGETSVADDMAIRIAGARP